MRATLILSFLLPTLLSPAAAQEDWFPYPIEVWDPPFSMDSPRRQADYTPLPQAERKWNIHVFFPHMKDSYWLAANYGVVAEARRLGVALTLHEAGGYDHLDVQRDQLEQALEAGVDAVIVGAISYDGLDSLAARFAERGIPLVDLINGMGSDRLAAKSLVSFAEMGGQAGSYLARLHPVESDSARIAFFPGPQGAGWVQVGEEGFRRAVSNGALRIVDTRYGDTGNKVQTRLIEEALDADSDIDYIVGTAVTAEAAVKVIRKRGLQDSVRILSYYFNPGVHRGIRRGQILAAPTDATVVQGRIAVDQAVRLLQGADCMRHVGPRLQVIDRSNITSFDQYTSLAPRGFRATYSVY